MSLSTCSGLAHIASTVPKFTHERRDGQVDISTELINKKEPPPNARDNINNDQKHQSVGLSVRNTGRPCPGTWEAEVGEWPVQGQLGLFGEAVSTKSSKINPKPQNHSEKKKKTKTKTNLDYKRQASICNMFSNRQN